MIKIDPSPGARLLFLIKDAVTAGESLGRMRTVHHVTREGQLDVVLEAVISALRRMRQEKPKFQASLGHGVQASLGHGVRSCLYENNNIKNKWVRIPSEQ